MDTQGGGKAEGKQQAQSLLNMVVDVQPYKQPWVILGAMIVLHGCKTAKEYDAV